MEETNDKSQDFVAHSQPTPPKKTKSRKITYALIAVALVIVGAFYFFTGTLSPSTNLIYHVPKDAFLIIESDKPFTALTTIKKTDAWKSLQQNEYIAELTSSLTSLDESIDNLDIILEKLSNRQAYVSGHMYNYKSYDFLYTIDVQGLGAIQKLMTALPSMNQRDFKNQTIYEFRPKGEKDTFYFCFVDNVFIGSYTHTLVENGISEVKAPVIGRSFEFLDINKEIIDNGLFRLYAQHDYMDDYLTIYDKETNYQELLELLNFSGLSFDIEDDYLKLEGFLNYKDTVNSLFRTINQSGKSKHSISHIAPKRTALYLSFGFDDTETFYDNLVKLASDDEQYGEDFAKSSKKLEKFLNISIKEDFMSWIGNSVAILHTTSDDYRKKNQFSLVISTNDTKKATEKLDFILKQVRKKTPVKFKQIEYKGHAINFIAIKGFFKLIFGKLFSRLEKPYYTLIDGHVVFSNSPHTLRGLIDDHLSEITLSNNAAYRDFQSHLSKSSIELYVQTPLFLKHINEILEEETYTMINNYSPQLKNFPQVAISLIPYEDMLATNILARHGRPDILETGEGEHGPSLPNLTDTTFNNFKFDEEFITEEEIHLEDLTAKKQEESFETGKPKYEVSIKDGKKHGHYIEYYPNEIIKVKGRYKEDKKHGTWKYYDQNGNLIHKSKFKEGIKK